MVEESIDKRIYYSMDKFKDYLETTIDVTYDNVSSLLTKIADLANVKKIDIKELTQKICDSLPKKVTIDQYYNYIADQCVVKTSYNPEYNKLASYILVERLHNMTEESIVIVANSLYNNVDVRGHNSPLISNEIYSLIVKHGDKIQKVLNMSKDYDFDYFAIRTLERSYLMKIQYNEKHHRAHDSAVSSEQSEDESNNDTADKTKKKTYGIIVERPQHMFMRVALGIHGKNLTSAFETYELLSNRYFTHATPTLFNSGTPRPQMSSCFLISMDDSIEEIFGTISEMAYVSKWAGGIGVHLSAIRSKGSIIRGTNGKSDGIVPLSVVNNKVARYINQGGKRNGSIAEYLEPWHADVFEFCELRKNTGAEDLRARDLFLALWIPDIFMQRVMDDGNWSLMCPDECPGLYTSHGKEFEELYTKYEKKKKFVKQVKARDLWKHIMQCQIETGFPYMLYKDHANHKSNQQNLGTIRSSNLCAEVIQYSDKHEIATCNLVSICLPRYIIHNEGKITYNFDKLMEVCRVAVRNLNKVIDRNYYPTKKAENSNMKHRPIGIGVQGLADVYNQMQMAWDSDEARDLNKRIFETMYYACVDESKELAKKVGHYSSFPGSPFSKGDFQFDLWGLKDSDLKMGFDWTKLREEVVTYGTRNSLLTALMPTASTAQIMGCYEGFEPYMSNIFVRTTLAGEFIVVNQNLVRELEKHGLWDDDMRKLLIIYNGSIQKIDRIPKNIKDIYRTAFELPLKSIIQQSAERGPFIDQSQSMNLFMSDPNFTILNSAHFYGWKSGLKTGMYYLRGTPAVNPINFGIDIDEIKRLVGAKDALAVINSSYNIADDETEETKKDVRKEEKQETKVKKMCKIKPGMSLEDCLTCSA